MPSDIGMQTPWIYDLSLEHVIVLYFERRTRKFSLVYLILQKMGLSEVFTYFIDLREGRGCGQKKFPEFFESIGWCGIE